MTAWEALVSETDNRKEKDLEELAELVGRLQEAAVLERIGRFIRDGVPPADILNACQRGMRLVGLRYQEGEYFIAGLILAGEIMRQTVDLLRPVLACRQEPSLQGRVLLGTIAGDIHDIGKNIFKDLLECHGFTVLDLGVDVPPEEFIKQARTFRPHLIGVSTLITGSYARIQELVRMVREANQDEGFDRPVILVGGGQVDQQVFSASGADYWDPDAWSAVKLCQRLVEAQRQAQAAAQDDDSSV